MQGKSAPWPQCSIIKEGTVAGGCGTVLCPLSAPALTLGWRGRARAHRLLPETPLVPPRPPSLPLQAALSPSPSGDDRQCRRSRALRYLAFLISFLRRHGNRIKECLMSVTAFNERRDAVGIRSFGPTALGPAGGGQFPAEGSRFLGR